MKWSISAVLVLCLATACTHPYTQGKRLYQIYCANCHMEDGSGLVLLIPPLNQADFLQLRRADVPCVIRYGSPGGMTINGETYTEPMPSFRNLNETELSNLINYINTAWDNHLKETSPGDVSKALEACPDQ